MDTTIIIEPGCEAEADGMGNLEVTIGDRSDEDIGDAGKPIAATSANG